MRRSPVILNLGCGTRTHPNCVNIDWSITLRLKSSHLGRLIAPVLLSGPRLRAYRAMTGNVLVHDLRTGIPANADSVDAVYHSHVLEHIDRDQVPGFFAEVMRVLRPGGVHRIVVPDLEAMCRQYLASLDRCIAEGKGSERHEAHISAIVEQMVRREARGTSRQKPTRRRIENAILGDARKRGETHQWMYDGVSLRYALEQAGFHDVTSVSWTTSSIGGWGLMGLDLSDDGQEYKRGSLYLEAVK